MSKAKIEDKKQQQNPLALVKKDTVDVVAERVRAFQERGEIHFPANYSPENAMKSAWLALQTTKDKDGKPALTTCTRNSIANALLNMVIQGLNPAKEQGYFIVYGNQLVFQRSYFGTMAVTKQVTGARDIYAQAVYRDDEFEYAVKGGRKEVIKHVQRIENIEKGEIVGAYCVIEFEDARPPYTDIMTIDQLKTAWAMSQMKPIDDKGNIKKGSTHEKFTEEMAKKTVISRACKGYINSSNDGSLIIKRFQETDEAIKEAQLEEEIAEEANQGELIDVNYEVVDNDKEQPASGPDSPASDKEKKEEPAQEAITGPGF